MGVSLIKIPFLTDQKLYFLCTFRESVSVQNMNIGDKNGQDENGSQVTKFWVISTKYHLIFRMILIQMIIINLPVWLSHPILKSFKLRTLRISCFHKCYYEAKVLVLSRSTPYVTSKTQGQEKSQQTSTNFLHSYSSKNKSLRTSLTLKISPFSLLIIMISCSGLCVSYSQP